MFVPSFKEWVIRPSDPEARRALGERLGLHPITAAVLVARGTLSGEEAKILLSAEASPAPDPFLLGGMESAVDRLRLAILNRERIVIYGDYDVDGISATALYLDFFKSYGHQAAFYIPHRMKEGYGLNRDAVRRIAAAGISLLITVDCGTTSVEEIALAQLLGMDVIVTDHHLPGETLPPAFTILNPCLPDSGYPFQGLCSTGLAYKVAAAYAQKYGQPTGSLEDHLDLVALATIADIVSLHGENRWMIWQGLRRISDGRRPGLRALKAVSESDGACGVGTIGFQLAPRINAAGRLGDAADAVRLLVTEDEQEAMALAEALDLLNRERQQVEERVTAEAIEAIEGTDFSASDAVPTPIVLASRSWHPGVVGIAASRLVERYHRPAVLIAVNDFGKGRGSARSIPGVNICEGIAQCREHLESFGGHAAAAGLTLREDAVPRFRERLAQVLEDALRRTVRRRLVCDAEAELFGLFPATVRELDRLGPFGMGNPEPTLVFRRLRISSARLVGNNHLKLMVRPERGPVLTAFGYGMGALARLATAEPVDLACSLEVNTWNGTEGVQLRLKDLRSSHYRDGATC
jgi:single-stranded-DNA-specific exonuclease